MSQSIFESLVTQLLCNKKGPPMDFLGLKDVKISGASKPLSPHQTIVGSKVHFPYETKLLRTGRCAWGASPVASPGRRGLRSHGSWSRGRSPWSSAQLVEVLGPGRWFREAVAQWKSSEVAKLSWNAHGTHKHHKQCLLEFTRYYTTYCTRVLICFNAIECY